jgi:hypothetical protein
MIQTVTIAAASASYVNNNYLRPPTQNETRLSRRLMRPARVNAFPIVIFSCSSWASSASGRDTSQILHLLLLWHGFVAEVQLQVLQSRIGCGGASAAVLNIREYGSDGEIRELTTRRL